MPSICIVYASCLDHPRYTGDVAEAQPRAADERHPDTRDPSRREVVSTWEPYVEKTQTLAVSGRKMQYLFMTKNLEIFHGIELPPKKMESDFTGKFCGWLVVEPVDFLLMIQLVKITNKNWGV